jgi:hypothetical protein
MGAFFVSGSILAAIKIYKHKFFNWIAIISLAPYVISFFFSFLSFVEFFALPIIKICIGLKSTPVIKEIGVKFGNLSYGLYIYGFPV